MFGRIELAWPVRDRALRQRVIDECLVPYLHDTLRRLALRADGQLPARRRRRASARSRP